MSEPVDTAQRILDVAQALVQERGFNAVSYTDISGPLGIRNASVHYHFPLKTDLGVSLVRRYRRHTGEQLETILNTTPSARQRLNRYLAAYRTVIHPDGRICLCTVLAGDAPTLPESMRHEVEEFFKLNRAWLTQVLDQGNDSGELQLRGTPADLAEMLLAALEGAMLLARSSRDPGRFEVIGQRAIKVMLTA